MTHRQFSRLASWAITAALVVATAACTEPSEGGDAADGDVSTEADVPQDDGADTTVEAEPRWDASSAIDAQSCLLDLDCDPGEYCSLGACTSECDGASRPCAGDLVCSDRGRCLTSGAVHRMDSPPIEREGSFEVSALALRFGPRITHQSLTLMVTGLTEGEMFRYRLAATNDLVVLPTTEEVRVTVDAPGRLEQTIEIRIDRARVAANRGRSMVRVITSSGTAVVAVQAVDEAFGRFAGYVTTTEPWSYGTFPLAFEVWPDDTAPAGTVKVVIRPEENVLFFGTHVVAGRYDETTRRLTFAFNTVVHHTDLAGTEVVDSAPAPAFDPLAATIAADVEWISPRPDGISNALRRYLGRQIQASLTFDDFGVLSGSYAEVLHGATATPVTVRGELSLRRSLSLDGMLQVRDADGAEPFDYVPPAYSGTVALGDLPAFPGSLERPVVDEACATVVGCELLTPSSYAEDLNDCGEAAFSAAFGLGQELAAATGDTAGEAYRLAYLRCGGLMDPDGARELGPPDLTTSGCVDATALVCAFSAFDAAAGATAAPIELLRTYEGLFQVLRASAQAYTFLANEYMVASVRAPLARGGDEPMAREAEALAYAAYAYYLGQSVLFQPMLLEEMEFAPNEIPGAETETAGMHVVFAEAMREVLLTMARTTSTAADAVVSEARLRWGEGAGAAASAETEFLRRVVFASWLQGGIVGELLRTRNLENVPGMGEFRAAVGQAVSQFNARQNGLNPLGYDPSFVPIVQRSGSDPATLNNFEVLAQRYASSAAGSWLGTAVRAFTDFSTTRDQWNDTERQLRQELADRIDGSDGRIRAVCGVTPPTHPGWDRGTPRVPTAGELSAYRDALYGVNTVPGDVGFFGDCLRSGGGEIATALSQIDQAALQVQIARERLQQIFAQVEIETQRFQRVTDIRNRYLTFRLQDDRELSALEMAEYDVRHDQIEAESSSFLDDVIGVVADVAGAVFTGGLSLAVEWGISLVEDAVDAVGDIIDAGPEALISDGLSYVAGEISGECEGDPDLEANERQRRIAAQRSEIQMRQHMRAVEEANEIGMAESQAAVQQYLVRMGELRLEIQLASLRADEAGLRLSNLLAEAAWEMSRRDATIERLILDEDSILVDPTFRVTAERSALEYRTAFRNAQRQTFELLRALEYEINADTGLAGDVFAANTPDDLVAVQETLLRTLDCYSRQVGGYDEGFETVVSLRRDIFGITGPWADPVTGEVLDEGQQFRRMLLDENTVDGFGSVVAMFDSDLTVNPETGFAVSSTSRCNEQLRSIEVQLVGDRLGTSSAAVQLRQRGVGLLRSCASRIGVDLADDEIGGYNLADFNSSAASVQAGVNAWSGTLSTALAYRPVANTHWEMGIDPRDPANRDLDVLRIDDVLIRFRSGARALPPGGVTFRIDMCM